MRKTLLARSSPTRVTDEVSMIDLPTDGSLPDGACNDDHLGTLDAVRGAVHPISKGVNWSRSRRHRRSTAPCAFLPFRAGAKRLIWTSSPSLATDCPRRRAPIVVVAMVGPSCWRGPGLSVAEAGACAPGAAASRRPLGARDALP